MATMGRVVLIVILAFLGTGVFGFLGTGLGMGLVLGTVAFWGILAVGAAWVWRNRGGAR